MESRAKLIRSRDPSDPDRFPARLAGNGRHLRHHLPGLGQRPDGAGFVLDDDRRHNRRPVGRSVRLYRLDGVPNGTRAKTIGAGARHYQRGSAVIICSELGNAYELARAASTLASILSFVGFVAAMLGGWLGGELVERLGVGVDEGANLNAPNSLIDIDARNA